MFQNLSENLNKIFSKLKGRGILSEEDVNLSLRELRIALLEADVSLNVVREFIEKVKAQAIGQDILKSITPSQMMVKIVHDEILKILSQEKEGREEKKPNNLNLKFDPFATVMLVGLQGSGKTTSAAKLGLMLKKDGKKALLVSLDVYRPAAQQQLEILGKSSHLDTLEIIKDEKPVEIVKRALLDARHKGVDVIIFDTAGRLQIDEDLMLELEKVRDLIKPSEVLLTVDSMLGQEAASIAKEFDLRIDISGIILTKIDGDARGGAALSMKYITGKPIKLIGQSEKIQPLESFDPEKMANRILGMGDIVSLVEQASEVINKEEAEKMAAKISKGKFNMDDYMQQLNLISKFGGLSKIASMLPGVSNSGMDMGLLDDKFVKKQQAIISSFTKKERFNPEIINFSRKKRIAAGSGTTIQDINKLLKQFLHLSKTMKKLSNKGGMQGMGFAKMLGKGKQLGKEVNSSMLEKFKGFFGS